MLFPWNCILRHVYSIKTATVLSLCSCLSIRYTCEQTCWRDSCQGTETCCFCLSIRHMHNQTPWRDSCKEQKHDVPDAEARHSLNIQTLVCKQHWTVQVVPPEEADAMFVVPLDDSLQGFHILQSQLAHISHPFLLERRQTHVPVTHTTYPSVNTHLKT